MKFTTGHFVLILRVILTVVQIILHMFAYVYPD